LRLPISIFMEQTQVINSFVQYTLQNPHLSFPKSDKKDGEASKYFVEKHLFSVGEAVHLFSAYRLDNTGQKQSFIVRFFLLEKVAMDMRGTNHPLLAQYTDLVNGFSRLHSKIVSPRFIELESVFPKQKSSNGSQIVVGGDDRSS
jgi:hypothetical protein